MNFLPFYAMFLLLISLGIKLSLKALLVFYTRDMGENVVETYHSVYHLRSARTKEDNTDLLNGKRLVSTLEIHWKVTISFAVLSE